MGSASGGRAAIVNDTSRSFGQFRLTQFVENAPQPPNATSDSQQKAVGTLSQVPDIEQMAQVAAPILGQNSDRMPSVKSASQEPNQSTLSPAGFGALELVEVASNPILEGILGPNKDGRVRNPVPSKLKGKTDNKQGNFGVMHMGMSPGKKNEAQGRDAAAERDAAARRTSENTASRAKAAQQEKYVPPKKRGFEAMLNDGQPAANRGSPFGSRDDPRQRARPLAPDETKYEQARLLTLLRSINPLTVVDQICKAVAYFGGIPGAPPPEDGIFPESANTRETGALFIGWLAEIFPDLYRSPEVPRIQEAPPNAAKKRGRPSRGNKATPNRGEKGTSNEPPNSANGYGYGPAVNPPAWGLPQSLTLVNTHGSNPLADGGHTMKPGSEQNNQADSKQQQQPPSTPSKQQPEELPTSGTSASKRRRGRPKGSRNKGRNDGQQLGDGAGANNTQTSEHAQIMEERKGQKSPKGHVNTGQAMRPVKETPIYPPTLGGSGASKPYKAVQYPEQSWQTNSGNTPTIPPSTEEHLSPEERAVIEAFRPPGPGSTTASPVVPIKAPPEKKRKRAPPKPKVTAVPLPNALGEQPQPVLDVSTLPPSSSGPPSMVKDALQWAPVDSTPVASAAKRQRQRKTKATGGNEPPSRNQTASVVSSATPPTAPSTIPDSTAGSSQQGVPVSRPPAEGLEAHYERFANLQQQNGRSHTPTITPQQQLRQQQKTAAVPPPQSTPQQQQMQMQHQKSQQGSQREDQKMAQGSSARPSSTSFYNQRTSHGPTYSQQYPSHQPSQIYGSHQASPQMSNNSYRSASTHTLAQASPQFSQAENTYRTASPHTISQPQPSPSFSQTENAFRSSSSHTLAQPSPSYSQAENAYTRTTSAHTITQPSPSFSARPQTQAQSHYNHFPDSSYIDLPTLESLGHSGSGGNTSVSMSASGYGQSIGVGIGSGTRPGSNSLYGTTSGLSNHGLSNAFDMGTNDLLRVSRSGSNTAYGTTSGLGNTFETGTSELEARERLLRGLGRR